MTKTTELASAFLQRSQAVPSVPVRSASINAFNALFAVQELDEREGKEIEQILVDGIEADLEGVAHIDKDASEIKRLTKELKAIKRQEMVLIGERIAEAREIFKKYKQRSFRDWLSFTFGSFKTGYNYLSFYDLYIAFPEELRNRLKAMPAKAIYVLASKKAPLDKKVEIVKGRYQGKADDLIAYIRNSLGETDLRGPSVSRILTVLEKSASLLYPHEMDSFQRNRLTILIDRLQEVLSLAEKKPFL